MNQEEVDKSINNSFEQELIDNNYKIFKDNWKQSIRGFQKRFADKLGTKYFITIYHYNYKLQHPEWKIQDDRDHYVFEVQFRVDEDSKDNVVDISYSGDFVTSKYKNLTTLRNAEDFFEKMFKDINAEYYEKA